MPATQLELSPKSSAKQSTAALPYDYYSTEQWALRHQATPLSLTEAELQQLCGFREPLSLAQVERVYLPICQLIESMALAHQQLHQTTQRLIGDTQRKIPFIIGISGSVAVGKSTTSRLLHTLLARTGRQLKVDLITTDGFIYPNVELEKRQLADKKGFPESYDTRRMVKLLSEIRAGITKHQVPLYSHACYDIVPNAWQLIDEPDILILEGLNLLNTRPVASKAPVFIANFLDFSIFVDAETATIRQWYLERFLAFRRQATGHPERYFHRFTQMSDTEAYQYAQRVWHEVNEANLRENILPFKHQARLIMHKAADHAIAGISLRQSEVSPTPSRSQPKPRP